MPLIIMVTIKQSAKFSLKTPYYYSVGPIYCYLLTKVSGALTLELILLVSSIFIFYFFKVIRFGLTVTLSLSLSLSLSHMHISPLHCHHQPTCSWMHESEGNELVGVFIITNGFESCKSSRAMWLSNQIDWHPIPNTLIGSLSCMIDDPIPLL